MPLGLRAIFIGAAITAVTEAFLVNNLAPHLRPAGGVSRLLGACFVINLVLSFLYAIVIYPDYVSPFRCFPGPRAWNLVFGHGAAWRTTYPPGEPFRKWIEEEPNDGIIRIRDFLGASFLLLTTPATMKTVLVDNNYDYIKEPAVNTILKSVLGNGLILAEGDPHKFQRKHLQPSFSVSVIRDLHPVFWKKACELTSLLKSETGKPEFEFGAWCTRATLDIIGVGLSHDFNSLQNPDEKLVKDYNNLTSPHPLKIAFFILCIFIGPELALSLPLWLVLDVKGITTSLYNFAFNLSKTRRAELNDPKVSEDRKAERNDILSLLVKSNDFSDDELANQILTFMAAGHETTSVTVAWAVYCLSQDPKLMSELRAEIRANLPSPDDVATETISASTIDSMPLLNAVANETLRLYPVIPITSREAIKDTQLHGQTIPKGSVVVVSPWGINRQRKLWGENANEFVPQRWIGPDGKTNNVGGAASNWDMMTFLEGPRSCIGRGFAKSELKVLVAAVIGRYDVEITRDKALYYPAGVISTKAANGMWMKFKEVPGW